MGVPSSKNCSCCHQNVRTFVSIQAKDGKPYPIIICPNCDADANHPMARKGK